MSTAVPDMAAGTTRAEALRAMRQALAAAGLDTPDLDARLLLAAVLDIDAVALVSAPDVPLGASAGAVRAALARRLAREPVSRILGWREFYGRRFEVTPATLDPRPDSETLVDAVLAYAMANGGRERQWRILDYGTGTGCLLLTLLCELPRATGVATDISKETLEVAARNARRLGVADRARFELMDGLAAMAPAFDILVSNPPYIPSDDIAGLAPEVRQHDPRTALDGGPDGLAHYRHVSAHAAALVPVGFLALEVGHDQAEAVASTLAARYPGWPAAVVTRDLSGHSRCVTQITHR